MNRISKLAGVLLLGSVFGCSDVHPTIKGREDPESSRQILFTSEDLQNETAANAPIFSRDVYGYLKVTIPIRSAVDHDIRVDYQTQFFNAAGEVIDTSAWQTVTLTANTPMQVTDKCTSPAAVNCQVTFRPAQ